MSEQGRPITPRRYQRLTPSVGEAFAVRLDQLKERFDLRELWALSNLNGFSLRSGVSVIAFRSIGGVLADMNVPLLLLAVLGLVFSVVQERYWQSLKPPYSGPQT
ncbi:hypothetical protein GCM10022627_35310 [Haloarcula argentinensis]|uniref:Uncharacterized protein n=1 Tax=Haloarcula argentinensis TaxID=43776 RepID=A0A830FLL5_HALAR|nr:hypothetical protein GCM10009006_33540 [Haloarcula argentinensis]